MLKHPHPLDDVMDSFNLSNVVLGPICFRNVENSSLIDVILTNTPRRLTSVLNVSIGISDFHNFTGGQTKCINLITQCVKTLIDFTARFNEISYLHDLNSAPFTCSDVFNDVDDQYGFYN